MEIEKNEIFEKKREEKEEDLKQPIDNNNDIN